jgi:adenylate kinase
MTRMLIIGPLVPGRVRRPNASRSTWDRSDLHGRDLPSQRQRRNALGREAKKFMEAGDFVPDRVTNSMVRDRLDESDVHGGFLLDGYPRTTAQVDYLDGILARKDQKLDVVVQLTADDEELVARLLGRAKEAGRTDDTEDVIRHRLKLYHDQTTAVVSLYSIREILNRVDGIGSVEEVTHRVLQAVKGPPQHLNQAFIY